MDGDDDKTKRKKESVTVYTDNIAANNVKMQCNLRNFKSNNSVDGGFDGLHGEK